MSAPSILLVEDDEAIRESLVDCLELEGYTIHPTANGAAGLAWLRAGNRPQLVVVDLLMPIMGGEEFLQELRGAPATRELPVVLMTAVSPSGRAPLPAADALLEKPFDLDDLLGAVRRFVSPPA
jgi:two-component system, chemotaxis family, chemotaxis protein CheY